MERVKTIRLKDGWGVEVILPDGRRGVREFHYKKDALEEEEFLKRAKPILKGDIPVEHLVHIERYGV